MAVRRSITPKEGLQLRGKKILSPFPLAMFFMLDFFRVNSKAEVRQKQQGGRARARGPLDDEH